MTDQALTVVKQTEPWRQRLIRSLLYGRNVDRTVGHLATALDKVAPRAA